MKRNNPPNIDLDRDTDDAWPGSIPGKGVKEVEDFLLESTSSKNKAALAQSINRLLEKSIAPKADFALGRNRDELFNIMTTHVREEPHLYRHHNLDDAEQLRCVRSHLRSYVRKKQHNRRQKVARASGSLNAVASPIPQIPYDLESMSSVFKVRQSSSLEPQIQGQDTKVSVNPFPETFEMPFWKGKCILVRISDEREHELSSWAFRLHSVFKKVMPEGGDDKNKIWNVLRSGLDYIAREEGLKGFTMGTTTLWELHGFEDGFDERGFAMRDAEELFEHIEGCRGPVIGVQWSRNPPSELKFLMTRHTLT